MSELINHEVVEVEQALIDGGLPAAEVLKPCDVHGAALQGQIDTSAARPAPDGHSVDVFRHAAVDAWQRVRTHLNAVMDKEEQILLPMGLGRLDEAEWGEIARLTPEIGYCLVVPAVTTRREAPAPVRTRFVRAAGEP
jgi:DUF438 domain-containing protein